MKRICVITVIVVVVTSIAFGQAVAQSADLVQVRENFTADPGWEGMNNRIEAFNPPRITQDFGWSQTKHTGGAGGELGGTIWRSCTIAYYALTIGKPLTFKDKISASGKITLMPADKVGGAYIGFFNHARQEWRPWSSMAFRLGDYPRGAEIHLDYMTATWRANGVRLPLILPADKSVHTWRMEYDPDVTVDPNWPDENLEKHFRGGREKEEDLYQRALKAEAGLTRKEFRRRLEKAQDQGLVGTTRLGDYDAWWKNENLSDIRGCFTFQLDDGRAHRLFMSKQDRDDPVVLDRFGIFNFQLYGRHWEFYDNETTGTNCEFYVGDLTVNGEKIDLSKTPGWEGVGNRVSFVDRDFHGRHDFGYSATWWAGEQIGEIGGTVWRNETIDPLHAFYADDVGNLTLDDRIQFSGNLVFVDGATDGDVYIGFFNKQRRLTEFTGGNRDYPPDLAEKVGGRRNIHLGFDQRAGRLPGTMGFTIGGPTRVGFYFAHSARPPSKPTGFRTVRSFTPIDAPEILLRLRSPSQRRRRPDPCEARRRRVRARPHARHAQGRRHLRSVRHQLGARRWQVGDGVSRRPHLHRPSPIRLRTGQTRAEDHYNRVPRRRTEVLAAHAAGSGRSESLVRHPGQAARRRRAGDA